MGLVPGHTVRRRQSTDFWLLVVLSTSSILIIWERWGRKGGLTAVLTGTQPLP